MDISWETIGGVCTIVTLIGGAGVKWITSSISAEGQNRATSATQIQKTLSELKADSKAVTDAHDKRLEKLEDRSNNFLSSDHIKNEIDHAKNNVKQDVVKVERDTKIVSDGLVNLRDRVTVLETEHKQTNRSVERIESDVKEIRIEINTRFDQMAATAKNQFDQLCTSIREVTKREAK